MRPSGRFLCSVVLLATTAATFAAAGTPADTEKPRLPLSSATRRTEPTWRVNAGLDGEIYPMFAHYAALQRPQERNWGMITVAVTNSSDAPLRHRVAVRVRGWSDEEVQWLELGAGESRTLLFAPTFLPRLFENREIAPATAVITATDAAGHAVFSTTAPVRMRSVDDIYWGNDFKYARFIASWVTPHDARVEAVLSRAKEFMPGRRLPGYEAWKNQNEQRDATIQQARAIYRALQDRGVSYVKSSITFGRHASVSERVRMPGESLRQVSANCIDGVVIFASLFENLSMDPEVIIVPGHAYVGVRVAEGSDKFLYIDAAITGRASFDEAVRFADQGLARWRPEQVTRVSIPEARDKGIFPMPTGDPQPRDLPDVAATRLR